ncbi:hypothetical protein OOK29_09405 [Streptomyces phaeochromogenes]|uniref:hypothetical protein n=1 Tax=Streptomyces phaeochromogenes TaxID=1923 RepID=UPI00225052EA|nr:hypothetical protein [Streptomyces phaeochromogenes]MCX5598352.1 hypothetical protein [Streptomyces phaeochromogenes]
MSIEPLTPFDEITSGIRSVSPFQAVWNEAEELLLATRPDGFDVEEIGRLAFEELPEAEKAGALDELFCVFWTATLADRETRSVRDGGAV